MLILVSGKRLVLPCADPGGYGQNRLLNSISPPFTLDPALGSAIEIKSNFKISNKNAKGNQGILIFK